MAYKGFTTITNQGDDLGEPKKNLSQEEIVDARDYALAAAAEPLFGSWGVGLTIALAIVATLSGLLASIYSVSRLYDMLRDMGQAPGLPHNPRHESLIVTAGLAIILAAFLDLGQIASMGVVLYLAMDMAIHWGVIRHLRSDIKATPYMPAVVIVLDLVVLGAFITVKLKDDLLTLGVSMGTAALIALSQIVVARRSKDISQ